jgi:protein-glutamine gamma-glutamyltransferase
MLLAWGGGAAIARLTGAAPVVIVLAAAAVWFVAAVVSGWQAVRRVETGVVTLPTLVDQGQPVSIACEVRSPQPVWVEARCAGTVVASGWSVDGWFRGTATIPHRGILQHLQIRVRSGGGVGLVWWRRQFEVPVGEVVVTPLPLRRHIPVERSSLSGGGSREGRPGAVAGDTDGVRPWREGDSEKYVHWTSTLRTGELVVHDRRHDADQRWVVRARPDTTEPDAEAGAARAAIENGLRMRAEVSAAVGTANAVPIPDLAAAARWAALADLGEVRVATRRRRGRERAVEPEDTARASARWWAAAATLVALLMLMTTLQYSPLVTVMVVGSVLLGAAVSAPLLASGEPAPAYVRLLVAFGALLAFVAVAASAGQLEGLLGLLRGPLPQILVILIALHGFECRDRRTVRVGLAISAVVLMYASGFRVDSTIGWWLLAWGVAFAGASSALAGPTGGARRTRSMRALVPGAGAVALGSIATVAVLAVVPVPNGPARLSLPTFIDDASPIGLPGAIAGPDGDLRNDRTGSPDRAPAGQAGGYNGFAQTMDTSVRGDLSDDVVMRVRASEPDFWRGQTFAEFDGRRWYADQETGSQRAGPDIDVPPALGDTLADDIPVERFVQTFYAEADLPNVVFGAYRSSQVIIDADVWVRTDGAIRASTILPAGSVYTVVSERPQVTEALLVRQGRIDRRLSDLGRQVLGRYLELPASTSDETIALANELAAGQTTTYGMVRAFEAWMGANVQYDLNAPVPDPGEDAVHDFLFDSRLGFCEQIASALTIMLRTQGVPARLATGYVAGTRDRIAGVYEVRGSDAHAWVEVWFPETGWQAFDPTASVPLSGESASGSIGSELVGGAAAAVAARPGLVVLVLGVGFAVVTVVRIVVELWRRRRRGRWGVLQDRFGELAVSKGAAAGATNPGRARHWSATDEAALAHEVAERLDRVVFDPTFADDDDVYDETRQLVGSLADRRR